MFGPANRFSYPGPQTFCIRRSVNRMEFPSHSAIRCGTFTPHSIGGDTRMGGTRGTRMFCLRRPAAPERDLAPAILSISQTRSAH